MKMRMRVQAGTKPVDEGDRAKVQVCRVCLCSTGAMNLQALLHHAQKDTQRRIERAFVALQVVADAFQHLPAHRQQSQPH